MSLPRVELHRHLEGSLRVSTLFELATRLGIPLPAATAPELAPHVQVLEPMDDLSAVLTMFDLFARTFADLDIVRRLTREVVEDAAAEGISLLELRFSPGYMTSHHDLDWDGLMEAVIQGVADARAENPIVVGLIPIISRSLGMDRARRTVDLAKRWRSSVVGFDLADVEQHFPARMWAPLLKGLDLPLTVHSGEDTGPEFVAETLDVLGARRIGHGVAILRDPALTERVAREGIVVEACPTSNVCTRAVPSLEAHPLRHLLDRGVKVALCSDDPGLFGITLAHEWQLAPRLGLDPTHEELLRQHAWEGSFVPTSARAHLLSR